MELWFSISNLVINGIAALLHCIALALLNKEKRYSRSKVQIYLLTGMCLTEAILSLIYMTGVVLDIMVFYSTIQVNFAYYNIIILALDYYLAVLLWFFMVTLTVDRFLAFYLDLKYRVYITPGRMLKFILISSSIISIVALPISIVFLWKHFFQHSFKEFFDFSKTQHIILTMFYMLYLILAIVTYVYIFIKYKRRKIVTVNLSSRRKKGFNTIVPTLIILTYLLFIVVPQSFYVVMMYVSLPLPPSSYHIIADIRVLVYFLGFISDPLIYIIYGLYYAKRKPRCGFMKRLNLLSRKNVRETNATTSL